MSQDKTQLPLGTIERMLKEATEKDTRISRSATEELQKVLSEIVEIFAQTAEKAAKHSGRSTIKDRDIIYTKEEKFGYILR
jgi:histone H3/H4